MKYNEEKVLYLADRDQGLHMSRGEERRDTDLFRQVTALVSGGMLKMVEEDPDDQYFRITRAGRVRLCELQIAWRKANGRSVDGITDKLNKLLEVK